jgi:hypothetical protein
MRIFLSDGAPFCELPMSSGDGDEPGRCEVHITPVSVDVDQTTDDANYFDTVMGGLIGDDEDVDDSQ